MGLLMDKPKLSFGSTNHGYMVKKFFQLYEVSADLTGIFRQSQTSLKYLVEDVYKTLLMAQCNLIHNYYITLHYAYCSSYQQLYIKYYFMEATSLKMV